MAHLEDKNVDHASSEMREMHDVYKWRKIFSIVSWKKDSTFIDKDSYKDERPFLWSLANS